MTACARGSTDAREREASRASPSSTPEDVKWILQGNDDERFARVARHLRGFDVAMVETGYRYRELYWAGRDRNWPYAKYQIDKIRSAVKNGIERRPKRGSSAAMLEPALVAVEQAIEENDAALFAQRFTALTATCNACHEAERVPFIRAQPPTDRSRTQLPSVSEGDRD